MSNTMTTTHDNDGSFHHANKNANNHGGCLKNKDPPPSPQTMQTSKTTTKPPSSSNNKKTSLWIVATVLLRTLCLDLPLTLVFGACGVAFGVQSIYTEFYLPLMERATRTDEQLQEEYTYYHRRCTERDVTTQNLSDLVLHNDDNNDVVAVGQERGDKGVELLMTHGAVVIPQVLAPSTVKHLREYAVHRNRVIPEHEQYPVSQGENRISFGYDATEHPAVVQAVKEVASHPMVQELLQRVLGDHDPASTEITTITQYYGAPEQAWHSDTKEDGNALKFARTYSHSYSLFLPLQNTTQAMGATDLCPGTHYCSNFLNEVCDRVGKGMNTANADQVFKAGDGVLLNQHVWHRGAAHRDPHGLERIVLIMSFLARPKPGDTRQLSRGTYFHQKWNMWGHTVKDAKDPMRFMSKPFSLMKCLSLWTPSTQNWGYDLVTATFMRFSNGQLGNDLTRLVDIWDNVLNWPVWLHGSNLEYEVEEKEAWKTFIQETIAILSYWINRVAVVLHVLYFGALCFFPRRQRGCGQRVATVKRVLVGHSLIALTLYWILHRVRYSHWGEAVSKGRALMRPFPPVSVSTEEELAMISSGPTTYPNTWDVLQGTRFDAPWLGAYERWLDGHPGNQQFRKSVSKQARFYPTAMSGLPDVFSRELINRVIRDIRGKDGRFLQQDYRNGDWRAETEDEAIRDVQLELSFAASPLLAAMRTRLDRMIAVYRFGTTLRSTALARKSTLYLWKLKLTLAGVVPRKPTAVPPKTKKLLSSPLTVLFGQHVRPLPNRPPVHIELRLRPSFPHSSKKKDGKFRVGLPVWLRLSHSSYGEQEETWFRGDILSRDESNGLFTVGLENGVVQTRVSGRALAKYKPPTAGDTAMGCFGFDNYMMMVQEEELDEEEVDYEPFLLEDCYEGKLLRVMPDGSASILYGDGDYEFRKPAGQYYLPPFEYLLPDGK